MSNKPLLGAALKTEELKKIKRNIQTLSPNPKKVKIIAVTKNFSYLAIEEAYKNKILNIGENKIQEIEQKLKNKKRPRGIKIHLIGHLQTNKAKKAVLLCDVIQTIDTEKIAIKVNKEAQKINKKQKIYLQINIGKDPRKKGFSHQKIFKKCKKIKEMKNLKIEGIMTILPEQANKKEIKQMFLKTQKISDKIKSRITPTCTETSMGMSQDYKEALECGATNIRIGTKLYGSR